MTRCCLGYLLQRCSLTTVVISLALNSQTAPLTAPLSLARARAACSIPSLSRGARAASASPAALALSPQVGLSHSAVGLPLALAVALVQSAAGPPLLLAVVLAHSAADQPLDPALAPSAAACSARVAPYSQLQPPLVGRVDNAFWERTSRNS
ncbi:hypothetical protein AXF42_Ash020772 [Apostasia shenzhenica]|uniref:Uncharacterized protein n=1 Tax=Apostasia shenzhenica TaxID=1088818 RepID=A0A2I0A4I6_9ASPA|nr:hypothetical protein AXF42_Ash020772 [Apostasia shenzhenica]